MSFKAEDHKEFVGFKIMNPGQHLAKIIDIKLSVPSYDMSAYTMTLMIEGPELGGEFVGLAIDKNDPSKGNYKGSIGFVQAGQYTFKDYEYQGRLIGRDEQMFRWLNNLCKQMGVLDKMTTDKVDADTIEEYVEACKKYLINDKLWGTFIVGGKEYFKDGYERPSYYLFFPKADNKKYAYSAILDEKNQPVGLLTYNPDKHIIKKPVDPPTYVFPGKDEGTGF